MNKVITAITTAAAAFSAVVGSPAHAGLQRDHSVVASAPTLVAPEMPSPEAQLLPIFGVAKYKGLTQVNGKNVAIMQYPDGKQLLLTPLELKARIDFMESKLRDAGLSDSYMKQYKAQINQDMGAEAAVLQAGRTRQSESLLGISRRVNQM